MGHGSVQNVVASGRELWRKCAGKVYDDFNFAGSVFGESLRGKCPVILRFTVSVSPMGWFWEGRRWEMGKWEMGQWDVGMLRFFDYKFGRWARHKCKTASPKNTPSCVRKVLFLGDAWTS